MSLPLKMTKTISILAFLAFFAPALQAQVITTPEARSSVLDGMNASLANVDRPEADLSDVDSPFEARRRKKVEPVATKDLTGGAITKVAGKLLPDETALRIISDQFRPLGSLVLGDRGLLQLAGGHTIERGDTFKAEIRGNIYDVLIAEVTSRGYTLRLGTAELKKNFLNNTGSTE